MAEQLVLTHKCAPGDIVCLTSLPRDIATAYPGRFEIHTATHCKTLWANNPYVVGTHSHPPAGMRVVKLDYGRFIREANHCKLHFLTAFHRDFQARTNVAVPCLHAKGDLYLSKDRDENPPISGRYWLVISGGKSDFTAKVWSARRWQQTVDALQRRGITVVQCGARHKGHKQPKLDGVLDVTGQTDLQEFMWLIRHAEGCISPVTCMMHAAAVFDKPCVVLAGGREHWWWEAYVNVKGVDNFGDYSQPVTVPHRYLHTQGLLECCKNRGCWKNKILKAQKDKRGSYCRFPTPDTFGQVIPKCLDMISVNHVVEAVMSYYENGTLPPIGQDAQPVLPASAPPTRKVRDTLPVDLFAAPEELLRAAAAVTRPDVPTLVRQFKGDNQKRDAIKVNNATSGPDAPDMYDNPIIGGRFTVCSLLFGDYFDMHKRCISSIMRTMPPQRRQLRIATNAVCRQTRDWLDGLRESGHIHTLTHNNANRKKYPVMRELFHDPINPIEDKWILWFDDDTIADRDKLWAHKLCKTIVDKYHDNFRMFGNIKFWSLLAPQLGWCASRPWYHKRHWQTKDGKSAPNGQKIHFAAGGFWALETQAMREAGIPDEQLGHNGGDYMLAAQLWQAGYRTASFNRNKQYVHTSSVRRRGLDEIHTGCPGWRPGGASKLR